MWKVINYYGCKMVGGMTSRKAKRLAHRMNVAYGPGYVAIPM